MRSLERIVVLYCHDVRPSVCPSGTGVHCDHNMIIIWLWLCIMVYARGLKFTIG